MTRYQIIVAIVFLKSNIPRLLREGQMNRILSLVAAAILFGCEVELPAESPASRARQTATTPARGPESLMDPAEMATLLFAAVQSGPPEIVADVLAGGASPNSVDDFGWSPLLHAAAWGRVSVASVLLAHGADPTYVAPDGASPGLLAAMGGSSGLIELLSRSGTPPLAGTEVPDVVRRYMLPLEEQPEIVAAVQNVLRTLGYDPGPSDGVAGQRTRAAIRQLGEVSGMQGTNSIDRELLSLLESLDPSRAIELRSPPKGWQRGTRFRDCEHCPEMIVLPTGSFQMDTGSGTSIAYIDRPIAMGQYEVTADQWNECVHDGVCRNVWQDPIGNEWDNGATGGLPMNHISWSDAREYTRWLSLETAQPYRLPTETEWAWAAQAGTASLPDWRSSGDPPCVHENLPDRSWANAQVATYLHNIQLANDPSSPLSAGWKEQIREMRVRAARMCDDGFAGVAPVGSFRPNPFGLYDVWGNAAEFVLDRVGAPPTATRSQDPWLAGSTETRFFRGVGAVRAKEHPDRTRTSCCESWSFDTGFRVVSDLDPDRIIPGDG